MPVDDIEVHEKVRHAKAPAGCFNRTGLNLGYWSPDRVYSSSGEYVQSKTWNRHSMTRSCRQIGRKVNGEWVELDECVGCQAEKDLAYIIRSREMIDA